MPYTLIPKSHASHLGLLRLFLVYADHRTLSIWILFANFHLNLFVVLLVFIWIAIVAIRRLGSGEWNDYEQEGEQQGLYNEGMPSRHIYLPVCKCACFIVYK